MLAQDTHPNPPTSTSLVQICSLNPPLQSSSSTWQYECLEILCKPAQTWSAVRPKPMMMPIMGIIHTHFSLGSFCLSQGRSCSPLRTLLDLKYTGGAAARCKATLDGNLEPGAVFGAEP